MPDLAAPLPHGLYELGPASLGVRSDAAAQLPLGRPAGCGTEQSLRQEKGSLFDSAGHEPSADTNSQSKQGSAAAPSGTAKEAASSSSEDKCNTGLALAAWCPSLSLSPS